MSADVPSEDAAIIADVLVETDLRGVTSHGVKLLPYYIEALRRPGQINPRPVIRTLRDAPALVLLDGDRGMGHLVAVRAMRQCLDCAKQTGMAGVGVRNSCHFGMAAYYAMMALPHDMIGFCTTNVEPIMTVFGGVDPVIGNNPQAFAIPAGTAYPIVLDLAHSVVAAGKVGLVPPGSDLPPGWVVGANGEAVTDPRQALADLRLLPAGGAKGSGLGFVMEILAGVMTGAKFGQALRSGGAVDQEVGHFFWAIDLAALADPVEFKAGVDELVRQIKQSRPVSRLEQVSAPGERGWRERDRRLTTGIPIPIRLWENLKRLVDRVE